MPDHPLADGFPDPLHALIDAGGPVAAILLGLSLIAVTIVLVKSWQFMRLRLARVGFVDAVIMHLRAGDLQNADRLLAAERNPIARAMHAGLQTARQDAVRIDNIRDEVTRVAIGQLALLRTQLRSLELIAGLSPLLGLLGTVLGMIEAFRQLEAAGSRVDPAILSGGIWEALTTTAVGIAVAIPTLAAHAWLEQRVERFRLLMEDALTRLFTQASPEHLRADGSAAAETAQPR